LKRLVVEVRQSGSGAIDIPYLDASDRDVNRAQIGEVHFVHEVLLAIDPHRSWSYRHL
jgi:hypothetical protein